MTVEHTLANRDWGGTFLISEDHGDLVIEIVAAAVAAAVDVRGEFGNCPSAEDSPAAVTSEIDRAAIDGDLVSEPFLVLEAESPSGKPVDFVDAFIELANRGFFSPGALVPSAERLERVVVNDRGDMRWLVRLRSVATWSVQMLWVAFARFRRDGVIFPSDDTTVDCIERDAAGAVAMTSCHLPSDANFDVASFEGWDNAELRLLLSKEPTDQVVDEISYILELWSHVVAPGFPYYGGHMKPDCCFAWLDAPTEVCLELDGFDDLDPRALLTIGYWIQHEGERLGITGYRCER